MLATAGKLQLTTLPSRRCTIPIVNEDHLLVLYPNWAEWRSDRPDVAAAAPLVEPAASFCATCWGQGRIFEPAANGEGCIPVSCVACAVRVAD